MMPEFLFLGELLADNLQQLELENYLHFPSFIFNYLVVNSNWTLDRHLERQYTYL